jgi:hypothetical protein
MNGASPGAFEAYIGGFGGPSYGAWWDGEHLVYESFLRDYSERRQVFLSPSAAQWRRFWRTMDTIDVWSWLGRYGPGERFEPLELIRNGTHWSLTLAYDGSSIESSGEGGGPDSVDLEESERFAVFLEAVSRLIGGRAFN